MNKARKRFKVKKTKLDPSLITAVVADRADDRRIGARALARAPRLNKKKAFDVSEEMVFSLTKYAMEPTEAAAQTPSYSPYSPAVALFLIPKGKRSWLASH